MNCPNCNKEVQKGWKACPYCGTKLPERTTCPACGKETDSSWKSCPFCGAGGDASTEIRDSVVKELHQTHQTDARSVGGAAVGGGININMGDVQRTGSKEVEYEEYVMMLVEAGGDLDRVRSKLDSKRKGLGLSMRTASEIEHECRKRVVPEDTVQEQDSISINSSPSPGAAQDSSTAGESSGRQGESMDLDLGNDVSLELVWIPAGEFMMGSPASEEGEDDEDPQHKVKISKEFWMGKYPVTQEQYQQVMGENPSNEDGTNCPINEVSWNDAKDFCEELSSQVGSEVRLPTEAEWEYACRAGSATRYCFGDSLGRLGLYAWYEENSESTIHPVGEKKPNRFDLYDMHGNVWEWCEDWFESGYYGRSPETDPKGPSSGSARVLRGGSWRGNARRCRSAHRNIHDPEDTNNSDGFRIVVVH